MELDELKKAWGEFNTKNEHKLSEGDFSKMLNKKTTDLSERVGRNIRIGIGIVMAWIALGFTIDFLATPMLEKTMNKPYMTSPLIDWSLAAEMLIYLLIALAIIIFFVRYRKLEKTNICNGQLRNRLIRLINIIKSYKRMFYVILVVVLLYVVVTFSLGFFMEYNYQLSEKGIDPEQLGTLSKTIMILTFGVAVSIILSVYYLLFNIFFKQLYGRHLKQLQTTLKELDEAIQE
ncbi:MAG TPA: hypothetical protein PLS94_04110 [Prolixibacteraceae bacterium]|nr:hypothetical protein [Prolixibacteraceae bacterium]